ARPGSGRAGRLRPVRGRPRRGPGAGVAGRGARRARGRPRVPAARRRVLGGADPHLDRLQARQRGGRRAAATAPGRVLPLLRRRTATAALVLAMATVRSLEPADWPEVAAIYHEGIRDGLATFETEVPSWEAWDVSHLAAPRLVACVGGRVAGWAALSPTSTRR